MPVKRAGFIVWFTVFSVLTGWIPAVSADQAVDYSAFARVLKNFVNDRGQVDYAGLKADRADLDAFYAQIQNIEPDGWAVPQARMAFWINAYNAITLKVVTDHYPVKSIRRINFGLVWEIGRPVAGGKYSLGHIEHKILRPLGDPRVHFALNCASAGCPLLPREPFDPDRLDEQLEREARNFINNPDKVRLDRDSNVLYYSAIFDWFEEDFLKVEPDIKAYILRYLNEVDRAYIENHSVTLSVLEYDWSLNGR